jgi:aminoglycoside phosphotransferase (APT) family kinase protein
MSSEPLVSSSGSATPAQPETETVKASSGRRVAAITDDEALRGSVERARERFRPAGPPVVGIRRRGFAGATSYVLDVVAVEFADGRVVNILLKDFRYSRLPKHAAIQRRDRELCVYERLLDGQALGTPQFYGACWDEAAGRYWLLLEFVEGQPVREYGFEYRLEAAAWLGRLHGRFRDQRRRLQASDFLLLHDIAFFQQTGERAREAARSVSYRLARRLAVVLERYEAVLPVLSREPETLVHGSYRTENLLVVPSTGQARLCPVDWEFAGFGQSTYDLAFLCDRFRGDRLEAIFDTYERAADASGFAVRGRDALRHEVNCYRLHKKIHSLGHVARWRNGQEKALKVLAACEELAQAVT